MTGSMISSDPLRNYAGPKPGMNTQIIADYSREISFSNLIRMARHEWVYNYGSNGFDGTLDASGNLETSGTLGTFRNGFVFMAATASGLLELGDYVLTWEGTGSPEVVGTGSISISLKSSAANRKVYTISDWGDDDVMYFYIPTEDTGNVLNPVFCYIDYEGTCGPGEENEFYPPLLQAYEPYKHCVRFMNWQATNQKSTWSSWDNRKTEEYITYTHGGFNGGASNPVEAGVPLEVCIRFQNKLQANGWYCIPHEYDGSSVSAFCEMLADNVDPGLKVILEYSNEVWNSGFFQNVWAQARGLEEQAATGRFTAQNASYPFWAWGAYHSASCMDIASSVFADRGREDDLVRFLGIHVGSAEAKSALDTDIAVEFGVDPPVSAYTHHDAAGPAFYWGNTILAEPNFSDNGVSGDANTADGLSANTVNLWASGTLWDNVRKGTIPYESDVNQKTSWAWWENEIKTVRGLEMYGYEGGHHVASVGNVKNHPVASAIVLDYETEDFANLTRDFHLLAENLGFDLLAHFILIERDELKDRGYWGHLPKWSSLDDPDITETQLRYRALKEATGQHNKRNI